MLDLKLKYPSTSTSRRTIQVHGMDNATGYFVNIVTVLGRQAEPYFR
jgi:hypothetical protein